MADLHDFVRGLSPEERDFLWRRLSSITNKAKNSPLTIPPLQRPESALIPLSFSQQRLWFLHQLDPTTPMYNIPAAVRMRGRLDLKALDLTLNEIVRRHEALRTRFCFVDGHPAQMIAVSLKVDLTIRDARRLPDGEVAQAIQSFVEFEVRQAFDLTKDSLLRCSLLRIADDEHILVFTVHHIVSDGWSMGVLLYEMTALYDAFTNNRPSPLPDLPIQYADYASWQQRWIQSEELKARLSYWTEKLEGAPPLSTFPTDNPRPPIQTYRGALITKTFSRDLSTAVKELSHQKSVTLFMTLLAAFNVLLSRYSGQKDVLVGSPIANRNRPEIENLIGFFVNTLVFRTNLSGDPTFEELLARVRQTTTEGYAQQDLPFEKLVEDLRPERDLSHSPLFQVMFVLQNTPRPPLTLTNLNLELLPADSGTAKFDLTLYLEDTAQGLSVMAEYNVDLFDAETMARLTEHYKNLLEGVIANPNQRISQLPLLTGAEKQKLIDGWNDARVTYPRDDGLQCLVEQQVGHTPDAIAVVNDGNRITYRDLNARANQLARHLRSLGVGPEVLVGICMDRTPEMVIGLLGILKAGGAYVPLDPAYPKERLAFILKDSQASVLITRQDLLKGLPEHTASIVALDRDWDSVFEYSAENLPCTTDAQNLAYLIYTSGSTGTPKAVAIEHRSVVAFVHWTRDLFTNDEMAGVLASTSLCFDLSVFEIFATLSRGGKIILADNALHLAALDDAGDVTLINTVPSAMTELMRSNSLPRRVRTVNLAGEPIKSSLIQQIYSCRSIDRVLNLYGPSEDTTYSTFAVLQRGATGAPPIGRPIANTRIYLLDSSGQPVPQGVPGELYISGEGLARGYLGRQDLTAEKFTPDPFSDIPGARMYRTGDLARYLPDGNLDFLGRIDHQVKVRGFRIEPGEIENVINGHPDVENSVVVVREDIPGDRRIVAYIAPKAGATLTPGDLTGTLRERLPDYMVPSSLVILDALPLSPNGKVDRKKLPTPDSQRPMMAADYIEPQDDLERMISTIWKDVLHVERVGVNDNFFDLGGHSLLLAQIHHTLMESHKCDLKMVDLFKYPTIKTLANHLSQAGDSAATTKFSEHRGRARHESVKKTGIEIAIVGMACRFPGARNVREFWKNLSDGTESITFFSDDQLNAAGVDPRLLQDPSYVKARGVVDKVSEFDAAFFGFSPREAEIMDPQHRIFLECAWEALEDACCDPARFQGAIGVYAGVGMNSYVLNLFQNGDVLNSIGPFQVMIGNDKDFLAPRVSYKFGLNGPSMSIQSACSTSLVAAHMACQSLIYGECDCALAGGVSIRVPQETGYLHQEGSIFSPDGHCRAFDSKARGMLGGNGAGVVVLKRLSDALPDGDHIYAVIKGSAVNNDGSDKIGFTAPSVSGQAKVIAEALSMATVDPSTVGYVEAHGTGTELGDPIEIAALTQAFGGRQGDHPTCAIGSVKTNIGHLDSAAGIAGLIKASLVLSHKIIPPSLHFETPNPKCDFDSSPFYVNTELNEWKKGTHPRRAGVSSLGIGGTNAHVVLEEAPVMDFQEEARPWHLLTLSAKNDAAVLDAAQDLAAHLGSHPDDNLADIAYTLHRGRKEFDHRVILTCSGIDDARQALETLDPQRVVTGAVVATEPSVSFLFSGQGSQYVDMGLDLYRNEKRFRETVDRCAEILMPHLGLDLRSILFPSAEDAASRARDCLRQTSIAQPLLFVIEYALAGLWMEWGIRPHAMIGHSLGEYVAACIAGVFSLEDALKLVAARGRLMQNAPTGSMLSVTLPESELASLMPLDLSIAAINSPRHSVVSGLSDSINSFRDQLVQKGISCTPLQVSHAFHSELMDSILEQFAAVVGKLSMKPPKIPFVSNLTGDWIKDNEAIDPAYWTRHLRGTVRFSDGLRKLFDKPGRLLLEIGPGTVLSSLAKEQKTATSPVAVFSSMRHPHDQRSDLAHLLSTLGRVWLAGVPVDWDGFHRQERRRRVSLPTYPFQRQSYWIQPKDLTSTPMRSSEVPRKKAEISDWFYVPSWKRSSILPLNHTACSADSMRWLIFVNESDMASSLVARLVESQGDVITVKIGPDFVQTQDREFQLAPEIPEHFISLIKSLRSQGRMPQRIVHMWTMQPRGRVSHIDFNEQIQNRGFYCLLHLIQALGEEAPAESFQIDTVISGVQDVSGEGVTMPEAATMLGLCRVAPHEYPHLKFRHIDITLGHSDIEGLLAELMIRSEDMVVALRGRYRWLQRYDQIKIAPTADQQARVRTGGVYLITGGLGGVGLTIASYLAEQFHAKLILTGRSQLPHRREWDQLLASPADQENLVYKIRGIRRLEAAGAEVMPLSANVCSEVEMQGVFNEALARFGTINGVIHAAGTVGGGMIQRKSREAAAGVLDPKVKGSLVLLDLFKETQLDFLILFSSISAILGEFGQADFCAANAFLDALADAHVLTSPIPVISCNWDTWKEVGFIANSTVAPELKQLRDQALELGLSSEEGKEVFRRVLSQEGLTRVIISTKDLQDTIDRVRIFAKSRMESKIENGSVSREKHTRPHLNAAYETPRNATEQTIAALWQDLLGIDQIGINDNFFDLGGHSLLATQLVSRIRENLHADIPLRSFFDSPTIAGLAQLVQGVGEQAEGDDLLKTLLAEIEGLSPDEVQTAISLEEGRELHQGA